MLSKNEIKYIIKQYRKAPTCPVCDLPMKFFQERITEDHFGAYQYEITKEHKITLFECQKCYDLYEVETILEGK